MSKKVLILHGWNGSDFPHWQSWLAGELAKDYGSVSFPTLGDPNFPKLDLWKKQLKKELDEFKPDIVICHSLANTLWFHICNDEDIKMVEKLYLVAPPRINCEIEELKTFFPITPPKNLNAKEVLLVTSTNDPYLNTQEAKELQKTLDVDMKVINNGGHLNADSDYGMWPWMLEEISNSI